MTKRIVLSTLLCFSFISQVCAVSVDQTVVCEMPIKKDTAKIKASLGRLWSTYLTSLLLSGAIGATTGGMTRYFEKRFDIEASPIGLALGILGWVLESEIRNDSIAVLENDLDIYHIGHKKSLMFKCAWIASWLAYLHV